MRSLRYLPLTFLCGVHGFALFAPYLTAFLAVNYFIHAKRAVPVAVQMTTRR